MAYSNLRNLSGSFAMGSDEIQEMFCEHCDKHDSKYTPAQGFCVECLEYMCDMCLKYHKRYVTGHTFKDRDSMPQDFCFEKCSIHAKQLVKFYCENCKRTACSDCKTNEHSNCMTVSHLPTLVESTDLNKEVKIISKNIDRLSKETEDNEYDTDLKMEKTVSLENLAKTKAKQYKENLLVRYQKYQKEIFDGFDQEMEETIARLKKERQELTKQMAIKQRQFEAQIARNTYEVGHEIVSTKDIDQKKLLSFKQKNREVRDNLTSLSSKLVEKQETSQRCQLFITTKLMHEKVEKLNQNMAKLRAENKDIHYYTVEKEEVNLDSIGNGTDNACFCYKELPSPTEKLCAHHLFDLPSKSVQWSDLCLIDENTLLMTDCNGRSLSIYKNIANTGSYDSVKLSSNPWALTKVDGKKIAVTFPESGMIMLITFSESMTIINTISISVGGKCRGIAFGNYKFFVSYDTVPGKVQILDMSGKLLKTLDNDSSGNPLFDAPYFLTLNQENTMMYVSDYNKHSVTSVTLDGKVKAFYTDDQLTGPCHLTVDISGTVYVCGLLSNNVHQLSSDLKKVKILLGQSCGVDSPESVQYSEGNSRLYVGMWDSNTIKVFSLTPQ